MSTNGALAQIVTATMSIALKPLRMSLTQPGLRGVSKASNRLKVLKAQLVKQTNILKSAMLAQYILNAYVTKLQEHESMVNAVPVDILKGSSVLYPEMELEETE